MRNTNTINKNRLGMSNGLMIASFVSGCIAMLAFRAAGFSFPSILVIAIAMIVGLSIANLSKTKDFQAHIYRYHGNKINEAEIKSNRSWGYIGMITGLLIGSILRAFTPLDENPAFFLFCMSAFTAWIAGVAIWVRKIEKNIIENK